MTRKDYIAIAEVLRQHEESFSPCMPLLPSAMANLRLALVEIFKEDSERFDETRFLNAARP
jgi:hypothetical protein